jgi:hypothetical protein
MGSAHKGQILPIINQMIPIDKETRLHADYDYALSGFNQGELLPPYGPTRGTAFNGVDTEINLGTDNRYDLTGNGEISVWVRPNVDYPSATTSSAYRVIVAKSNGGGSGNLCYYFDWIGANTSRSLRAMIHNGVTAEGITVSYDFKKQWTYLVFKWTSKQISLYANNILLGSVARTISPVSLPIAPLTIGVGFGGTTEIYRWSGEISDLKIKHNDELIAHLPLAEEGVIARDISTYGNDTAIIGGFTRNQYGPTVATLKKEEGKFRGAVLIEPDTKNIFIGNGMNSDTADVTVSTIEYVSPTPSPTIFWRGTTKSGTGNCYLTGAGNIDVTTFSTTWTVSCYLKRADGLPVTNVGSFYMYANAQDDGARINANAAPTGIINYGNGWYRVYRTQTLLETASISLCGFSGLDKTTEWHINGWQLETREGSPTSYVPINTSRPTGRLWYPKELINPASFTISCWFNIPYMHRSITNNAGINGNWFHPIIEIAGNTTAAGQSFGLIAGPEPASYSRKLQLQVPTATTANLAIQDNVWYHMITTFDGATYKVYIDGVQQISIAGAAIAMGSEHVLMVGGGFRGKTNILIDELRIESRAISLEEVESWAASGIHYNYLDYRHYVD